MTVAARAMLAAAVIAGCVGGRGASTLPAAGKSDDDGAGQLAQASIQIKLGDGLTDIDAERDRLRAAAARYHGRRGGGPGTYDAADAAYAGSVYGLDTSVGGAVYGFGGIGRVGFGIVGPALPPRTDGGDSAVLGVVTWRGDRGVAWPAGCAGARVARAGGATAGALVFLANAPLRRDRVDDDRWTTARGAIEADGCALWPAAQAIGPVPALIDVENGGSEPLALALGGAPITLEPGGRWKLGVHDDVIIRIDADRRGPAWVLGQPSDYHTVTDALGRFAIDDVPAGSYDLVVWYPPLVRAIDGDRPLWTEPTVLRRRITVGERETVRLGLALSPSP